MIRTAILTCALVAIPSLALAQTQIATPPELRILRQPAAAPGDGPPADYIQGMAPEYNGWVYQEIDGSMTSRGERPLTTLYQGVGYPATIMVCPRVRAIYLTGVGPRDLEVLPNSCATVTTDTLRVYPASLIPNHPHQIRYRILAVHRAAD